MALANYMQNIKSSGIYRFVFDKSELPATTDEPKRLIVGYSENGPFNTPVYVESISDFKKLYSDVNKKLERYGDYFHRSCIQALASGPILALNVKNFNQGTGETEGSTVEEKVQGLVFDMQNVVQADYTVEDIYDKSRFWYLEPKNLRDATQDSNRKYMYISATDSKNCSNTIFIRPVTPKGYDITFKDWFATVMNGEELPSYLEEIAGDKLENYFMQIFVFRGKIDEEIAKSDAYKKFFCGANGTPNTPDNICGGACCKINKAVNNAFGEDVDALSTFVGNSKSNLVGVYTGIVFPDFVNSNNSPISLADLFNSDNDKHKMMMFCDVDMLYDDPAAAADLSTVSETPAAGDATGTSPWDDSNGCTGIYLEGYTYGLPKPTTNSDADKLIWQNKILDALKGIDNGDGTYTGYKGLRIALTDRMSVEYRYLIDTFDTYITREAKSIFANICKDKENALAILNFPKAETIKSYQDYVVPGNNESLDNIFVVNNMIDLSVFTASNSPFSLATEENGASFAAYYTPVKLINPTTGNKYAVPSAALVSNDFMEKYVTRLPYSIVAGPNYGKINVTNLIGPDYLYSKEDRDYLEPFGVNCLVYVPRKGTYINSNQTAKQNPVTALSKVHIRELVTFLQDEIEKLLQNYQWEFNTHTLRDTIKAKADVILFTCQKNQGIYDFETQCDEKNNTREVIDNEMLILDYGIEPARGAGKMIQQLTIYRTGGLKLRTL